MPAHGFNGGEVSRVLLIYHPDNFASAVKSVREALGVLDFQGPYEPTGYRLRFMISFSARLELITPSGETGFVPMARQFLMQKGEGFFGLTYRISDLAQAEDQATAAGFPRRAPRLDCLEAVPDWRQQYAELLETPLGDIAGVNVALVQTRQHSS